MRVAVVQLNSGPKWWVNLHEACERVQEAIDRGAELIVLPEVFLQRGVGIGEPEAIQPAPSFSEDQPEIGAFSVMANDYGVHILLGSLLEENPDGGKPYNTSVLLGPGGVVGSYRKVHLFDIDAGDGAGDRESDRYAPGDRAVVADTALGKIGLAICYDLRFPELFRRLALGGAQLVTVPANFTKKTGQAHWSALLRARAIENGLFVIAAAQCGSPGTTGPGSFEAYGHSMVIDPWGEVLLEFDDQPGLGVVEIDVSEVERVRAAIPSLANRRPGVYGL
ncbi:MAG: carbon-nitrogen hydrolase family protein [Planctomycetota bacterium]